MTKIKQELVNSLQKLYINICSSVVGDRNIIKITDLDEFLENILDILLGYDIDIWQIFDTREEQIDLLRYYITYLLDYKLLNIKGKTEEYKIFEEEKDPYYFWEYSEDILEILKESANILSSIYTISVFKTRSRNITLNKNLDNLFKTLSIDTEGEIFSFLEPTKLIFTNSFNNNKIIFDLYSSGKIEPDLFYDSYLDKFIPVKYNSLVNFLDIHFDNISNPYFLKIIKPYLNVGDMLVDVLFSLEEYLIIESKNKKEEGGFMEIYSNDFCKTLKYFILNLEDDQLGTNFIKLFCTEILPINLNIFLNNIGKNI